MADQPHYRAILEQPQQKSITENVQKLVESLLGPHQNKEQYETCEKFALHQVNNHRYLNTNSHEVSRKIDSLVQRFTTNNMSTYADTFQQLISKLHAYQHWEEHYEVDLKWSLIDFMLSTTYQPTQNVRRNRAAMDKRRLVILDSIRDPAEPVAEAVDEELLAALQEDFVPLCSNGKDSDYSDDSDFSSEDSAVVAYTQEEPWPASSMSTVRFKSMAKKYTEAMSHAVNSVCYVPQTEAAVTQTESFQIIQPIPLHFKTRNHILGRSKLPALPALQPPKTYSCISTVTIWPEKLLMRVHAGWWRQDIYVYALQADKLDNKFANFAISYAQFLQRRSCSLVRYNMPRTTTEKLLLREIIFMFFAPVSCFNFVVQQGRIEVRKNATISTVTAAELKIFLEGAILPGMQAMHGLRQFVDTHTLHDSTGTYGCFAVAVRDLTESTKQRLFMFEELLINPEPNDCPTTLLTFANFMKQEFADLELLWSITKQLIEPAELTAPHVRSIYLLVLLFNNIKLEFVQQNLATTLLLCALKIYSGIVDAWWRRGVLEDWRNEFIVELIQESETCKSFRQRELTADEGDPAIIDVIKQCPLYHVLRQHSIESSGTQNVLANLNCLTDMLASNQELESCSFYMELILQVYEELQPYKSSRKAVNYDKLNARCFNHTLQRAACAQRRLRREAACAELAHVRDKSLLPLLMGNILEDNTGRVQLTMPNAVDLLHYFNSCSDMCLPLQDIVLLVFERLLQQRRRYANMYVIHMYRHDMMVGTHVSFLRQLLLLESDYLLYPFYTRLFHQIESGEQWARKLMLNTKLSDVLAATYAPLHVLVHIEVVSPLHASSTKVYEAIGAIELQYNMEWPLQRIITAQHMQLYNAIFRLMIKVKWAAWKLENLKFLRRGQRDPYAPLDLLTLTVRRLEILRFWLIYLVNNLHTHLCTYVLQSLGAQFSRQLSKCQSYCDLINLHDEYIGVLAKHCLVTPDFADFRLALEQLLHLVFVLDMEWCSCCNYLNESHALSLECSFSACDYNKSSVHNSHGLEYLALNQVVEIENTYIRCHQMMGSILRTLVYKHKHSFLHALELVFNTSVPY